MSPAEQEFETLAQQMRGEIFEMIQAIERPVRLSLKPGTPDTPEIREYVERVERELNAQVKDPNSDFNRGLAQAVFEECS